MLDGGRAGRLFPTGDPEALATALADVLTDPQMRAELARRGGEVVAAYDWRVVARDIVTVYETVMEVDGVTVDDTARL